MQRKKTLKNRICEHYAVNSLFYKSPSLLFIFGHLFLSIFKKFSDFIFFYFSLRKFLKNLYWNIPRKMQSMYNYGINDDFQCRVAVYILTMVVK
jgi:hypothetical protein